jgi:hypothetical protein
MFNLCEIFTKAKNGHRYKTKITDDLCRPCKKFHELVEMKERSPALNI